MQNVFAVVIRQTPFRNAGITFALIVQQRIINFNVFGAQKMNNRESLVEKWGQEVVLRCCRYWKSHYGNGGWGTCGICRRVPLLFEELSWDDPVVNK